MKRHHRIRASLVGLASIVLLGLVTQGQVEGQSRSRSLDLATFRNSALLQHNTYRATHQAPAMAASMTLNASAQGWANYLAAKGLFEHSDNPAVGENLYVSYTTSSSVDAASLAKSAVTAWYNEVEQYDYAAPGFSMETGHFTQVVWKSSTQLGCGTARGAKTLDGTRYNAFYVVCHYAPPGNMEGEYPANVRQPKT